MSMAGAPGFRVHQLDASEPAKAALVWMRASSQWHVCAMLVDFRRKLPLRSWGIL